MQGPRVCLFAPLPSASIHPHLTHSGLDQYLTRSRWLDHWKAVGQGFYIYIYIYLSGDPPFALMSSISNSPQMSTWAHDNPLLHLSPPQAWQPNFVPKFQHICSYLSATRLLPGFYSPKPSTPPGFHVVFVGHLSSQTWNVFKFLKPWLHTHPWIWSVPQEPILPGTAPRARLPFLEHLLRD